MNSRSELVKGSHNTPYVTVLNLLTGRILEKPKSKATDLSEGEGKNGALAGDKVSNLREDPE